jgi:hypothetical protein
MDAYVKALVAVALLSAVVISTGTSGHRRIVAIGDVHGDVEQLVAVLQMSEVVNASGHWVGGITTLVQVGDLLDRGPKDKTVLDFFMMLRDEAQVAGGHVVNLIGNHEVLNLQGAFHYAHPDSHEEFGGKHNRKRSLKAEGKYGDFLRSFSLVHVEGRTLFVHAGVSPSYAHHGVAGLNRLAADAMRSDQFDAKVFGVHGPIWTRALIMDAMNLRCSGVEESLRVLDLDRMVVGHTPQRSGVIESYCDDKLIAIDVGISKWMYGHLAALEITEFQNHTEPELRSILPSDWGVRSERDSGDAVEKDPILLQQLLDSVHEYHTRKAVEESARTEDLNADL